MVANVLKRDVHNSVLFDKPDFMELLFSGESSFFS